jgi:anti-sigma regulatory factor (Ser/Thr protein kinase)
VEHRVETTRTFDRIPEQIPAARHFVRTALSEWGLAGGTGSLLDDVVLMASELFTNAVLHGSGDVEVSVALEDDVVRLCVVDRGAAGVPLLASSPPSDAASGRGLRIIDQLAGGWGSRRHHRGGTEVWLEVPVHRSHP